MSPPSEVKMGYSPIHLQIQRKNGSKFRYFTTSEEIYENLSSGVCHTFKYL